MEEKLREILIQGLDASWQDIQLDNAIAQIIQVFNESATEGMLKGWNRPEIEIVTRYERGQEPKVIMVGGKEVLTGQEWLDRFEKEVAPGKLMPTLDAREAALIAARKAAGL